MVWGMHHLTRQQVRAGCVEKPTMMKCVTPSRVFHVKRDGLSLSTRERVGPGDSPSVDDAARVGVGRKILHGVDKKHSCEQRSALSRSSLDISRPSDGRHLGVPAYRSHIPTSRCSLPERSAATQPDDRVILSPWLCFVRCTTRCDHAVSSAALWISWLGCLPYHRIRSPPPRTRVPY